jgi:hypothetical protein
MSHFLCSFDANQGFGGMVDVGQEMGLCAQTIYEKVWSVLFFAVPLHRQSERKADDTSE